MFKGMMTFFLGAATIIGIGVYGSVTKFDPKEYLISCLRSKKVEDNKVAGEVTGIDHGNRGTWSGWKQRDPGVMVAQDKGSYDILIQFINSSPTQYPAKPYEDGFVYVAVFGGEIKRKPGHDIEVTKIKKVENDFIVQVTVKAPKSLREQDEPCSSWVLLKVNKKELSGISAGSRFALDLTMITYDYVPSASSN